MKALTLHQPWASLVACGAKTIETRPQRCPYDLIGKQLAIHASKADPLSKLTFAGDRWIENALHTLKVDSLYKLPRGCVVCIVRVCSCTQVVNKSLLSPYEVVDDSTRRVPVDDWGDFSVGRWLIHFHPDERIVLDPPVEARGMQGYWNWEHSS